MSQTLDQYRKAEQPLPERYDAWQIFGAGFENVGKDGKPVELQLREPKDNEVLLRVDALGLCLSDIKVIKQGDSHPRIRNRGLATNPTVLGHECACTVVKAGSKWAGQFKPGQRFIVQADIYHSGGVSDAFGYSIPGGLAEYTYLDDRALAGDEGCYLIPVHDDTGYSQSALAEPWACVEMSYNLEDRFEPGAGPVCIVTEEMSPEWASAHPEAVLAQPNLEGLAEDQTFDDILVPDPTPEVVQAMAERLNPGGLMLLFGNPARHGKVSLDIGRIHYQNVRIFGGGTNVEEIRKANARQDLLPQGTSIFIGAGGPMGQMHVQRAIEIPCGSRTVVVTDLDRERLDHIEARFGEMAKAKGIALHLLAPSDFDGDQDAMNDRIRELAPSGYNDVCLLAPVAKLVTFAVGLAADNGLVNVFAGLPVGSYAEVELNDLCRGVKIFGSSGSRISDLRKILQMVEEGELNTNLSVAAIGGLNAAREGLEGVNAGRFPGKTVIYTQIPDLPLMSLDQIRENVPEVAAKLGPAGEWTKEAEEALIDWHLARQG